MTTQQARAMRHLVVATRNKHKTREFAAILGAEFTVSDLAEVDLPTVQETGGTFEENAALKAVAASRALPELIVADDSGLEVAALNGAPGIYSARYAGASSRDEDNVAKLLRALRSQTDREARFTCVLALARGGEILASFRGAVYGSIVTEPRGGGGFGYDPVFAPIGYAQTFAELGAEVKNRLSHRARAIDQLRAYLLRPAKA